MEIQKNSQLTKKIVQTGLFIGLALILRSFSYMVYFGGAPGMRISFYPIFLKLTAIIFGPIYGGVAAGIVDILGFLTKPEGPFIPWLTLTAILGMVLTGLLWKALKDVSVKSLRRSFLFLFIFLGVLGFINHLTLLFMQSSALGKVLNSLGKNRDFSSIGLEVISLLGLVLLLLDFLVERKNKNLEISKNYLRILIVTGISGIIISTLNTYLLRIFIPGLGQKAFILFWIPRIIQELLMSTVQAYIIAVLYSLYNKLNR